MRFEHKSPNSSLALVGRLSVVALVSTALSDVELAFFDPVDQTVFLIDSPAEESLQVFFESVYTIVTHFSL